MKKIIKIAIITIVSLAVLTSLAGNLYFTVWKQVEQKIMQKGFNLAITQIVQAIKMTGEVQISEDITLIQKYAESN